MIDLSALFRCVPRREPMRVSELRWPWPDPTNEEIVALRRRVAELECAADFAASLAEANGGPTWAKGVAITLRGVLAPNKRAAAAAVGDCDTLRRRVAKVLTDLADEAYADQSVELAPFVDRIVEATCKTPVSGDNLTMRETHARELLWQAFHAGFYTSSQGYNGEHGAPPDADLRRTFDERFPPQQPAGEGDDARGGRWTHAVQRDVADFHAALDIEIGDAPAIRRPDLRAVLILEGAARTVEAIIGFPVRWECGRAAGDPDLAKAIYGMCDVLAAIYGTAVEFGVDLAPFWDEVHRTNMAKKGGPVRSDGKRLAPPGWTPPDIAGVLSRIAPASSAGEGSGDGDR